MSHFANKSLLSKIDLPKMITYIYTLLQQFSLRHSKLEPNKLDHTI